jgi:hypothetical protein
LLDVKLGGCFSEEKKAGRHPLPKKKKSLAMLQPQKVFLFLKQVRPLRNGQWKTKVCSRKNGEGNKKLLAVVTRVSCL